MSSPLTSANVCEIDGWTFRFAEPKDAESFSAWVARNPQIDPADIEAASQKNNPTVTYLVIEHQGEPVMFMPVYLTMRIGYLGFNPAADKERREGAMEIMLQAVKAFALAYRIGSIDTLTRSGIPVAEWARAHGFNQDPRELFTLQIHPPEGKVQ
jgi:hypothetical protein